MLKSLISDKVEKEEGEKDITEEEEDSSMQRMLAG